MIVLKNTQKKVKIHTKQLLCDAEHVLELLGYADFDLMIWITNNATIQKYNGEFRNQYKATDILSFPFHPDLKPGKKIRPLSDDDKNLGDLIFSAEYIQADLSRWHVSFDQRMRELLVHGICHLLGYDHIHDTDFRVMRRKERALLSKLPMLRYEQQ